MTSKEKLIEIIEQATDAERLHILEVLEQYLNSKQ